VDPNIPFRAVRFPALISAGLIEAACPDCGRAEAMTFPALISAGLIEAMWQAAGVQGAQVFPALISAGLIEAYDSIRASRLLS